MLLGQHVVHFGTRRGVHPLVLPEGVASIPATFRPLTVTDANKGPFVSTPRKVIVCGGGTVTLPSPTATGTWVIGQGAEVVDNGTGDLAARWTVTNLGANRKARFKTSGSMFTCTVLGAGTMVIFR